MVTWPDVLPGAEQSALISSGQLLVGDAVGVAVGVAVGISTAGPSAEMSLGSGTGTVTPSAAAMVLMVFASVEASVSSAEDADWALVTSEWPTCAIVATKETLPA